MSWVKNATGVANGSFRSLNGAADENIFQGKASKAGFFCFFKVWRDMPYDAVLDHNGILYRIEVKGSSGNSFDFSRGGRSGAQISRTAASRKRLIDHNDCDFVVGVNSDNGDCYIVPTDIIEIIGKMNVSKNAIADFCEKWDLFKFDDVSRLTGKDTRDGLCGKDVQEVQDIYTRLGLGTPPAQLALSGLRSFVLTDTKEIMIFQIWQHLANI